MRRTTVTLPDPKVDIGTAIERERSARLSMIHGYHYWAHSGRTERPFEEHYCEWCAGWYGVPHSIGEEFYNQHQPGVTCRSMGHLPGNPQCACIDCQVYAIWVEARRKRLERLHPLADDPDATKARQLLHVTHTGPVVNGLSDEQAITAAGAIREAVETIYGKAEQ